MSAANNFTDFRRIREVYARVLPFLMRNYEATGRMAFDPYFMDWKFTPIEYSAWTDIRGAGLPFFPQVPVLNYFLDFACPFNKIAIECDGAAYHDPKKDAFRDQRLADEGWSVFRIPGHECRRIRERPFRHYPDDELPDAQDWYQRTSEGLIHAIGWGLFDADHHPIPPEHERFAVETLKSHCSTGFERLAQHL
ncbi:endonuclease domain-containing protein [Massilia sp. TS11]|uniref:endonuclease domain-containing protein n=1 Tax=Massilia sp. TS11 TaxID=2908003 RepID=UPI001ED9F9C7|nr:DUF559 domain-containing protein [Massilia sp. TS11]MCG2586513.1 endonuclease domain-containing protein [Massilia sp. TS11]